MAFSSIASRIVFGRVLGVVGLLVYNWWVVVAVNGNLVTNTDEFFSDLEAVGRPDANILQHLDLVAGLTLLAALLLRGSRSRGVVREEWPWLLGFAAASAVGGQFAYTCSEGLSAACRRAQWHLDLPLHHYLHVLSGIVEFATITVAIFLAWKRTRTSATVVAHIIKWSGVTLALAYPLLAVAYLADHYGAFVEPVFFICFSLTVTVELLEAP